MLYSYALAYLVAPETFASANVVELVHSLPEAVKYTGKVILAAPFAFHSWNGIRHLLWDTGYCESCRSTTAYVVRHNSLYINSLDVEGCLPSWLCCPWPDGSEHRWARVAVDKFVFSDCKEYDFTTSVVLYPFGDSTTRRNHLRGKGQVFRQVRKMC